MKNANWKRGKRAAVILMLVFGIYMGWTVAAAGEDAEVSSQNAGKDTVLVGGMPVGIYMKMDGVMVLGTEKVTGTDGQEYEPAAGLVHEGDYIVGLNETPIDSKEVLVEKLQDLNEEETVLTVRRNKEEFQVRLKPVECKPGEYKLGIWVRDNVQGLGTVTFLTQDSRFGALGHGIHDIDTNGLLDIEDGTLYQTSIHSIQKGENGIPGSMEGMIVYNSYNRLGTIEQNTEAGIYGTVDNVDALFKEQIPVETASVEEIETGPALIRCFVEGEIKNYDIEVTDVDGSGQEINKGIVLKITDPELLEKTGGIIQGMSGSPILQNGKLIGAVTHVFVQDSTRGYGIFIENMMKMLDKQS